MAKVDGPLFSLGASGKFGDVVFMRRGGQNVARVRVTPKNPNSPLQQATRLNLGNLSKIYNGGGTPATLTVGAGNSAFRVSGRKGGTEDHDITLRTLAGGNNLVLDVSVIGRAITVQLATDGAGASTSTAVQVRDAINLDPEAKFMVLADLPAASNGTGLVAAAAAAPLAGGVDAGPFALRRINRGTIPESYTDANVAILTKAERSTWFNMQEFVGFNSDLLSRNLAVVRSKPA